MLRMTFVNVVVWSISPTIAQGQGLTCPDSLYGNYEFEFSPHGIQHIAKLRMRGCRGTMEVEFFDAKSGRKQRIYERMEATTSATGILIMGSSPVDEETRRPYGTYRPDTLRFQTRTDGTLAIENCDGQLCVPVKLLSRQLPTELHLRNQCETTINVAVLYRALNDVWVRRGWWVIEGRGEVRPNGVKTLHSSVYLYAYGGELVWDGDGTFDFRDRWVVSNVFSVKGPGDPVGQNKRRVRFFGVSIVPTSETYTQTFRCDGRSSLRPVTLVKRSGEPGSG